MTRKGIILAGGLGTRLYPNTKVISKQLLPLYSKPTIFYPLSTLMLSGITEICIISSPIHLPSYQSLLGDGERFGCKFTFLAQEKPGGLAEALIISDQFLDGNPSALMLGDNVLFGTGLSDFLTTAERETRGAMIFSYEVSDPEKYGIATFDANGAVSSLEEKPENPKSNHAIVGLYFYDASAPQKAKMLTRSERGELEITDLNRSYLSSGTLDCLGLPRGVSWFDMGTPASMTDATNFIRSIEERTGTLVCSPEEVAYRKGLVTEQLFKKFLEDTPAGYYRDSLVRSTRGSFE